MAQPKRKFGMITFYVRPEFRKLVEKFCKFIEYDKRITDIRFKDKSGLLSIALIQLMLKYADAAENGEINGITEEIIQKVNRQVGE
ncbi:MAG: hypothetical protein M1416_02795 [Candidatus Pacearchaeota archaeon]|nr:hypothetical protein [Candidatus Pacearchaeota archaeon]